MKSIYCTPDPTSLLWLCTPDTKHQKNTRRFEGLLCIFINPKGLSQVTEMESSQPVPVFCTPGNEGSELSPFVRINLQSYVDVRCPSLNPLCVIQYQCNQLELPQRFRCSPTTGNPEFGKCVHHPNAQEQSRAEYPSTSTNRLHTTVLCSRRQESYPYRSQHTPISLKPEPEQDAHPLASEVQLMQVPSAVAEQQQTRGELRDCRQATG